jgi:DNA-binding beta-propeller fold protein YncE
VRSHAKASTAGSTMRPAVGLGRLVAASLPLAALLLLGLAPAAFAAPTRSYSSSFGSFSGSNPLALTVDQASGDIYVLNSNFGEGSVYRFAANGSPDNFTAGTDAGTNTLTGLTLGSIGEGEVAIDSSGGPAAGTVYVTNADGSLKIYKTDGSSLGTLTGTGTPAGSFASPCGVAVDQATGDLYVADAGASRIWRYSPSGATLAEGDYSGGIETSFSPCQLAADSGNVYATPFGVSGGSLTRFRSERFATGVPPAPTGAVIDATTRAISVNPLNGDVYANRGGEIVVYQSGVAAGGSPYYTFGSSADFGTSSAGVAVKAGGSAYVADRHAGGKQVDVYGLQAPSPSRSYSSSFGSFSGSNPLALTVDQASGDIYVLNSNFGEGSVYRFAANGSPDNFTAGTDAGTNTLTGLTLGSIGEGEVAIDSSGGPAAGTVYVTNADGSLKIYKTDGSSLGTLTGTGTPAGSFASPCGVAVDQATGDLYVADAGASRIWRYSPSGATLAEGDYSGGIETSFSPCQLAADSGNVYATPFGVSGGSLTRFRSERFATGVPPAPTGAVIDATTRAISVNPLNGDVYANRGGEIVVYQSGVAAGGSPYYTFGSSADFGTSSAGVAVKAGGSAYVADRHAGGKQVDVYGPEATGFLLTVVKSGPGPGAVTSSPPGINCGTICAATLADTVTLTATPAPGSNFKGWSGCNSVSANQCTVSLTAARSVTVTFTTKPGIAALSAGSVTYNSAGLSAQLNPDGEATSYRFEYVDDATYLKDIGVAEGEGKTKAEAEEEGRGFDHATRKPVPDAFAGSGLTALPVSVAIGGLLPATRYHFRVVAGNVAGLTKSPGEIFTTFALSPTFAECPNSEFRTGYPSAKLSDCRVYEQATPVYKNGDSPAGDAPRMVASLSGDAVMSMAHGGMPGGEGAEHYPVYVSMRESLNWSTQGLLAPPSYGDFVELLGWTRDLRHSFQVAWLTGSDIGNTAIDAALLMRSSTDHASRMITPSYVEGAQYGIAGASTDGSKAFFEAQTFEAGDPVQLTPDAAAGKINLYVYDRENGELSLAGVLPDGEAPAQGSFAGAGDSRSVFTEKVNAVSLNGDQVFFADAGTGQIYLRRGLNGESPETVHVSASQRTDCADHDPCNGTPEPDPVGAAHANFQAATPSGSKAFFTSSEELTDNANTGPVADIFQAGIGHADIGGTNANRNAIAPLNAEDVAVNGSYLYWADSIGNTIGRVQIDSSGDPVGSPDASFITGAANPQGVAVHHDSDGAGLDQDYLFWTNAHDGSAGTGTIGRATLDGLGGVVSGSINQSFITGASDPHGIDTNATYVYWANAATASIARADVDGSGTNQSFVDAFAKGDIAVNANYIYYSYHFDGGPSGNLSGGCIRIAAIDGSSAFAGPQICDFADSRFDEAPSFALDDNHLYYTSPDTGKIGRADLDASGDVISGSASDDFITHAGRPSGLAVDPAHSHVYWSTLVPATITANPGNDLYSWDRATHQLTDLTPDSTEANGAEVKGVIGASDDGSYVYFVAMGDLDGPGGPAERAPGGAVNLYVWHGGSSEFITHLGAADDNQNWTNEAENSHPDTTGRVSADGHTVVFATARKLTAYDNQGIEEFYRYNTASGLTCVTCNPTGKPATRGPTLSSNVSGRAIEFYHYFPIRHFVSSDGSRVFFESAEKLVAADTNGDQGCPSVERPYHPDPSCQDIYEWEAPGRGSCTEASSAYSAQDGGCFYLISPGTTSAPSYFDDASASGDDVFFFTGDQLVPQDRDGITDVYDASAGGGLAAQYASEPPGCAGEACRGSGSAAPHAAGAGSGAFSGPGNQVGHQLRDCGSAASRAEELSRLSKRLQRRARRLSDPASAERLRHRAAALARHAHALSQNARRCRRANGRAGR